MNSVNDVIAHSLFVSQAMLQRFISDLTPPEMLHRPADNANCCAWIVGHLVMSDRSMLKRLGVAPGDMPPLPDGFDKRFSRDEGCPQANEFGDVSILLPLFLAHREQLIAAARAATPDQLTTPVQSRIPVFKDVGECLNFMAAHTMMHTGQISTIRRSLGRPPVI